MSDLKLVHVYPVGFEDKLEHWPSLLRGSSVSSISERDACLVMTFDCGIKLLIPSGLVMVHERHQ